MLNWPIVLDLYLFLTKYIFLPFDMQYSVIIGSSGDPHVTFLFGYLL